jgi:hypothetical protein
MLLGSSAAVWLRHDGAGRLEDDENEVEATLTGETMGSIEEPFNLQALSPDLIVTQRSRTVFMEVPAM